MLYKLDKNAHKGRWESYTMSETLGKMSREYAELVDAVNAGNMVDILLESADIANFCLIMSAIAIDDGA